MQISQLVRSKQAASTSKSLESILRNIGKPPLQPVLCYVAELCETELFLIGSNLS